MRAGGMIPDQKGTIVVGLKNVEIWFMLLMNLWV